MHVKKVAVFWCGNPNRKWLISLLTIEIYIGARLRRTSEEIETMHKIKHTIKWTFYIECKMGLEHCESTIITKSKMQYRNSSPNTATIIEFCYLCARIIPTNWTFSSHSYVEHRLVGWCVCVSAMYTRNSILVANNLPIFQFTIPIFDRRLCGIFRFGFSRARRHHCRCSVVQNCVFS